MMFHLNLCYYLSIIFMLLACSQVVSNEISSSNEKAKNKAFQILSNIKLETSNILNGMRSNLRDEGRDNKNMRSILESPRSRKLEEVADSSSIFNRVATNMEENAVTCPSYSNIGSNLQSVTFDYMYTVDTEVDKVQDVLEEVKKSILEEMVNNFCDQYSFVLEVQTNDYISPIETCDSQFIGGSSSICAKYHTKIIILLSDLASLFDINDYEVTHLLALKTTQRSSSTGKTYYSNLFGSNTAVDFVSCDRVDTNQFDIADYYTDKKNKENDVVKVGYTSIEAADKNIGKAICTGDAKDFTGKAIVENVMFKYTVLSNNETDIESNSIRHVESAMLQYVSIELCNNTHHVFEVELNSTKLPRECYINTEDEDENVGGTDSNCSVYQGDLIVLTSSLATSDDIDKIDDTTMNTLYKHSVAGDFNVHGYKVEIMKIKEKQPLSVATGIEKNQNKVAASTKSPAGTKQIILVVLGLLLAVVILLLFTVQIKKRRRQALTVGEGIEEPDNNEYVMNYGDNSRMVYSKNVPASIFLDQHGTTNNMHQRGLPDSYTNSEDSSVMKPRYCDLGNVYKSQDVHRCVSASCPNCKHDVQQEKGVEFLNIS